MINIQQGALPALEQNSLPLVDCLVQNQRSVSDHRAQALGEGQHVFNNVLGLDCSAIVDFYKQLVFLSQSSFDFLKQNAWVKKILNPDAESPHLVRIGRADAATGCSNGAFAQETL